MLHLILVASNFLLHAPQQNCYTFRKSHGGIINILKNGGGVNKIVILLSNSCRLLENQYVFNQYPF